MNDPHTAERIRALVACLEDEYQALLAEDGVRLEGILLRKQQLLAELAALPAPGANAARLPPAVLRALSRARQMNQRNALALAPRMAANRARLRFLQAALGRSPTYTSEGALATGGGPTAVRARGSA